jgi:uncharacterized protein YjdB
MKHFFVREKIRSIAAITAAAVLLSFSGSGTIISNAEDKSDQYIPVTQAIYQVNPLYAGMVSLDEIDKGAELKVTLGEVLKTANKATTVDEAAVQIKEGLKSHSKNINVAFSFPGTNYNGSSLVSAADNAFNKAMNHTGKGNEGDYLKWGYSGRGMQVGYSYQNGNTVGTFAFTITYYTTAAQEQSVTAKVNQISSNLGLARKGEYDKIVSVYQYVCNNVRYNYGSSNMKYTCYAAAVDNSAVCQGYALLVYRLLNDAGVGCRMLAGNTSNGQHGWNIARVNGLYYNLDTTWDAGKSSNQYTYFMKSDADFVNHNRWSQYTGSDFYRQFPMASSSYNTGSIGGSVVYTLKLNKDSLSVKAGSSSNLSVSVNPSNADLKWSSSDEDVATVSSSGKVKGVAAGTCKIKVTSEDGSKSDTCYVTVTGKGAGVKSLKLNKKKVKLAKGKKFKLVVTIKPENANTSLIWKSSNSKVAKISKSGTIKAKGKGKCKITVTTKDGKKKATCKVTVR